MYASLFDFMDWDLNTQLPQKIISFCNFYQWFSLLIIVGFIQ